MVGSPADPYGKVARIYARVIDPINTPLRTAAVNLTPSVEGAAVLDVGCGTGRLLEDYVDAGAVASGVDLSEAMLAVASRRLAERADLTSADATALPFPDNSFDVVATSLFLHELSPKVRKAVMGEMVRVARPGGHLVVVDFRVGSLRTKGHLMRMFSVLLERLAGADHYRNWRGYIAAGGLPANLNELGLAVTREKITAGGNIGLWLVRLPS